MAEYIHDPKERLMARVKALLAIAKDKGATPAEASTAAEMASRLALKHSIDLAALNSTGQTAEQYKPAAVCGATEGYKAWKSNLVAGLALVNGCFAYTQQTTGNLCFYMVSGPRHCQEIITLTMEYLEQALNRLHREAIAYLRARESLPRNPKAFKRAFLLQASRVIYARLKEKRENLEAQTETVVDPATPSDLPQIEQTKGTALVPLGFFAEQERRAREAAKADQMKTRKQPESRNASGKAFGAVAGRKVGLDPQVGGGKTADPSKMIEKE